MKKTLISLALVPSLLLGDGLIDTQFVKNNLTHQAHWGALHGALGDDLGAGMLYYGLIYSTKAKLCICLGSGDGFVPRVMRQAQRDLGLRGSRTILVDGDTGEWGRPLWLAKDSFFRTAYPDVEIILDTTHNVAHSQAKEWQIDYLHIDADRTVEGAFQDFLDYLPFMSKNGLIALHDTGPGRPCAQVVLLIREMGFDVVNYEQLGTGVAIIFIK